MVHKMRTGWQESNGGFHDIAVGRNLHSKTMCCVSICGTSEEHGGGGGGGGGLQTIKMS